MSLLVFDEPATARLFAADASASVVALDTASSTVVIMKDGEPDQLVITSGVLGPAGPAGPAGADTVEVVDLHIHSLLPHPVYDDMIDLRLIYENGLI